jgi:hypothetical protein
MPKIDLSMLNQRQTPAFYADVLANRPAAGFIGRIFVSTNTYAFYRDNGTGWDLIGGPGTGTITGSGSVNQIAYWSGASTITGDNELFYDSTNNYLGVGTNTPGAAIDAHSAVNVIQQLNQTVATNNSLLAFQNAGAGLWRIGNYYNTGANDFGVFDVIGAIQPLTIKKTTGQVLIGTSTVGSGKLVVASTTSDNGIQIVGATAPSLRIDNAETAPTKRIGLGIATALNNFIQGAVDRDMTIFNGSTTASPILFGIYDTTNVQEAARISAARNFIVGKTTDSGERLQIQGTANFSSTVKAGSFDVPNGNYFRAQQNSGGTYQVALGYLVGTNDLLLNFSDNLRVKSLLGSDLLTIASSGAATFSNSVTTSGGGFIGNMASTNTPALLINRTSTAFNGIIKFSTGASDTWILGNRNTSDESFRLYNYNVGADVLTATSAGNIGIGTSSPYNPNGSTEVSTDINSAGLLASLYVTSNQGNTVRGQFISNTFADEINIGSVTNNPVTFLVNSSEKMRLAGSTGNLLIGTTTDAGQKLQVNGTSAFSATVNIGASPFNLGSLVGTSSLNSIDAKYQFISMDMFSDNARLRTDWLSGAGGASPNMTFWTAGAERMRIKTSGVINLASIPTSAAGLSSGDIYSNLGVLTIVP